MRSEAWRPAATACNRSPREAWDPALQALRPGCEELAVTDPAQMPAVAKLWRACSRSAEASAEAGAGERSAAPGEKPPRWSAERRASRVISAFTRVLTRYGTQGASQAPGLPRHVQAQRVLRTHPNVSRRSAHPRFGLAKQSCKPRAQK